MRSLTRKPQQRSDPAPSRARYRWDRLRLTPAFRWCTRRVLPTLAILGLAGGWAVMPDNRAAFGLMIADIRAQVENRPEFRINLLAIDGAPPALAQEIRDRLSIPLPASSLDLDLVALENTVTAFDAVESARLRLGQGGVLSLDVTPRVPALLWRGPEALVILDASGVRAGVAAARQDHPDLPIIAGEGARDAYAEALTLFAAMGPLAPRLRGLERMGARRWDVVLDQRQRILLPERDALRALERAVAMVEAERVLAPSVRALDLRLPRRPTLRLHPAAAERRWDIGLHRLPNPEEPMP